MSLASFLWILTKPKFALSQIQKAAGLLILALFLTSLTGIDPKTSILGDSPYFQGLILYSQLYLFSIIISKLKKPQDTFKPLMLSASLVSLVAIKHAVELYIFNLPVPTYAGRVVSTFGQPNFYAGWILLTLPLFYYQIVREKRPLIYIVGFLICILAIVLSYSKTAIFLTGGLILFWLARSLGRVWKLITILVVVTILSAAFFAVKYQKGFLWEQLGKANPYYSIVNYSPEKRAYIWPTILDLISKSPILGYGLENLKSIFGTNIRLEEAKVAYAADLKNLVVDRSHNYLLDLAIFAGILGVISWLFLVYVLLRKAKGLLLTSLLIYLIWVQFQNQSVVHLIYFWWLLGLIDQEVTLHT